MQELVMLTVYTVFVISLLPPLACNVRTLAIRNSMGFTSHAFIPCDRIMFQRVERPVYTRARTAQPDT